MAIDSVVSQYDCVKTIVSCEAFGNEDSLDTRVQRHSPFER